MSNYVDQIQDKEGTLHDIQDKRLVASAEDVGKIVSVNENGQLVLVENNAKLYRHVLKCEPSQGYYKTITFINSVATPYDVTSHGFSYTLRDAVNSAVSISIGGMRERFVERLAKVFLVCSGNYGDSLSVMYINADNSTLELVGNETFTPTEDIVSEV